MDSKHTATPYEVHGDEKDQFCILSRAECREVATIDRHYTDSKPDFAKEKATADFIARACNAHDRLVMLLRERPNIGGTEGSEWNEKVNALLSEVGNG